MRRIVREAAADDAAEGSRWLEIQVDPTSYAPFVGGITPALEIVLDEARAVSARGRHRGRPSSSRRAGCATPSRPARSPASPPSMPVTTRATSSASGCRTTSGAGVVADFAPAFAIARRAGLALVPHGGELLGAQSVMETLEHLDPDRIGHGVRCVEDPAVLDAVAEAGVTLEVCPGSNVALGVYADARRGAAAADRRGRHTRGARGRRPAALRHPAGRAVRRGPRPGLRRRRSSQRWPGARSRAAGAARARAQGRARRRRRVARRSRRDARARARTGS